MFTPLGQTTDSFGPFGVAFVPTWFPITVVAVFMFIFGVAPILCLFFWYRMREKRKLALVGKCPSCGYDLTGNESGVCPECGASAAETTSEST